ncbi:MAG: Ig-like domain-containing protein [Calditrichota bacterium]
MRLRNIPGLRRSAALILAAGSLLFLQCSEEGQFNPVGPPARITRIVDLTATPAQVSVGGGSSVLTGRVIDQDNKAFPNLIVRFEAAQGAVTAADTTDTEGHFTANYSSGEESGTDTILVSVGDTQTRLMISVVGASADLSLTLTPTSVLANGIDTVQVVVMLVGRNGPLNRVAVRLDASNGTFYGQRSIYVNTGVDGRAITQLTAPSSNQTIVGSVTATVDLSQTSDNRRTGVPARPSVGTGAEACPPALGGRVSLPVPLQTGTEACPPKDRRRSKTLRTSKTAELNAETSSPITFRGVSVEVSADPTLIPGDGQARSTIRARVREVNLQAVPRTPVTFSAIHGTIPYSALTDDAGTATVSLISAPLPGGDDIVVARYGPVLSDSVAIRYAPAVGRISLASSAPSVIADGLRKVQITATVLGGTGQPAPRVEVTFTTNHGALSSSSVFTDNQGRAVVDLTPSAAIIDSLITIRGTAGTPGASIIMSFPSSERLLMNAVERENRTGLRKPTKVGLPLKPEGVKESGSFSRKPTEVGAPLCPSWIMAADDSLAGSVEVTARGVQIRLSANPDSIIARREAVSTITAEVFETTSRNPIPNDTVRFAASKGSIPAAARLDNDGRAQVILAAGDTTGRAIITGRYGISHRDSAWVDLLPRIGQINVSSDRPTICAGGIDRALVTVTVRDALGGCSSGARVNYYLDTEPGVTYRVFTDAEGRASLTLTAPPFEADSAMKAYFNAGDKTDSLRLRVLAVSRRITADPDSLSLNSRTPVAVSYQAFELSTRRPVSRDTVWFSACGGVIQPFAVLDTGGVCRTAFTVGGERGEAWVIGQLGELKPDSFRLELFEPVAFLHLSATRRSILANGVDTTQITALVTNVLGQPAPDVWTIFTSDAGSIEPSVVRSDNQGRARCVLTAISSGGDESVTIHAEAIPPELVPAEWLNESTSPQVGKLASLKVGKSGVLAGGITSPTELSTLSTLSTLSLDEATDSLTVQMRGVTLRLRADPREIRANGRSKAGINVQLVETASGAAIAQTQVRLGASRGAIPAVGVTGPNGTFIDSLTAGD